MTPASSAEVLSPRKIPRNLQSSIGWERQKLKFEHACCPFTFSMRSCDFSRCSTTIILAVLQDFRLRPSVVLSTEWYQTISREQNRMQGLIETAFINNVKSRNVPSFPPCSFTCFSAVASIGHENRSWSFIWPYRMVNYWTPTTS